MKKIITLIAAFVVLTTTAFVVQTTTNKSSAIAEQREGFYIFMFSKPAMEYEHLGTVKKTGLVWSGKPEEMFNILLRRAKKDYPKADAIIFTNVDMDKADCIKFK